MYKNNYRRLSFHEQLNRISITIICTIIMTIYLTRDSMKTIENERNLPVERAAKRYLCPQTLSSSEKYFYVDFTETFPLDYSTLCEPHHTLLVYVLSATQNYERRNAIRQTWANKNANQQLDHICFIFIVGLSTYTPDFPYYGDIEQEAWYHKDIVQLNLIESYENVPYKEVGSLKWSHLYAPYIPYLFKTDDDLIVDTLLLADIVKFLVTNQTNHSPYLQVHKQLHDFIQTMSKVDKHTLFKGRDFVGSATLRRGKFGVHEFAWNHIELPPYCSGFGFLYSSFIRDRLYRASLCYVSEYVPLVGDVFVSGFLAGAASVRCSGWSLMYIQSNESCSPNFIKNPDLLVCSTQLHLKKEDELVFQKVWQTILDRHRNLPIINRPTNMRRKAIGSMNSTLFLKQRHLLLKKNLETNKEVQ